MSGVTECIFCRIVAGEIPAQIVGAADSWLAFRDVDPKAPHHILVIPRRHIASLTELTSEDAATMGEIVVGASRIAAEQGMSPGGYRLVVNAGRDGGQSVDHIHFHLLGGRHMTWPPG
jgi:histidine triad (HIT) family protein